MRLKEDLLRLENPFETIECIEHFLRDYVKKTSVEGAVLGMSGGLDSSVAAALCSKAFRDPSQVLGLCMPEEETYNEKNIRDAERVADMFGLEFRIIDVTPMVQVFCKNLSIERVSKVVLGNLKTRVRAVTLYWYSNSLNRLVVGTTDKSELMLG
ncbi:NAD(+) synthase [Candidatus Bathyarchaeota archaeon]|nr:NAD(+) synthase [Candidatus Bathyarchaeota archaeon]MBS7629045.1 NAD(+) synthase [Candidatus Bathyarchaeota archaeon]